MPESGGLLAAFLVGLAGLAHCGPMCGGIQAALAQAVDPALRGGRQPPFGLLASYNLGRITSYTIAGAVAGGLGALLLPAGPWMRLVAGLLLIAIGLQISGAGRWLDVLEAAGRRLWRHLYPLGRGLLPVRNNLQAIGFGMLWGWLPCGLVYSVLAWSMLQPTPLQGALTMLAFGLGTLPALLTAGLAMERFGNLVNHAGSRLVAGALIIGCGAWTIAGALMQHEAAHRTHDHAMSHETHEPMAMHPAH